MDESIDDRRRVSALMQAVNLHKGQFTSESLVLGTAQVFYYWLKEGDNPVIPGAVTLDDDIPF